jgi:hypothetical protein
MSMQTIHEYHAPKINAFFANPAMSAPSTGNRM